MKLKKFLGAILAICMVLSFSSATYAASHSEPRDSMEADMIYLVDYIGQRLATTPNEDKAAEYIKNRFEAIGYTNVEWAKPSRTAVNTGRVVFSDGSGDILGNPLPNSTAFSTAEGRLVDLGTYPDLSVPAGVTGKVVGAVRFNGAPNIANLNSALAGLELGSNVEFTGALLANADTHTVASVSGTPNVPCITTTNYFLNRALAKADRFSRMERYSNATTNAVIATKPAPTGDPDLIIVVSSHMDCALASPGASDNASGATATVELARRLFKADLGNIEVRFAVCGSEESGGMAGSVYVANRLVAEGKANITINLNMDMICSPSATSGGSALNAVSMDINTNPLAFNLPAYLVTDDAKDISWAEGIDNVRIYRYGSSDHVSFASRGMDAGSMIVVTDSTDDIEVENHNSRDNLEQNYSYERHLMCTKLMENAILKAASQEISKRAKFYVSEKNATVTLVNAEQLFKTYDQVSGNFAGLEGNIPFVLTPEKTVVSLANAQDYTITDVSATGTGNADNKSDARNEQYKSFKTALTAVNINIDLLTLSTEAHLVKAGDSVILNASFDKPMNSNTAILTYTFDDNLFEYVDFNPAPDVTVLSAEDGDGFAKITVMKPSYDIEDFGDIELRAKADAELTDGLANVVLGAQYVVKDSGEKEVKNIGASASFTTIDDNRVLGDTNGDCIVDLIDLSNIIDWFGIDSSNTEWHAKYVYFDFNNNRSIDVSDVSFVALLVQ